MAPLVIVLTGGNKGIGYAIAEALLSSPEPITLYLTARSPQLGEKAISELRASNLPAAESGSEVRFHQLDITSASSITALAADLASQVGHIDVLINNAGIFPQGEFGPELAKETVGCNYDGTKAAILALLPLIKKGGRIVNVSSTSGAMKNLPSKALREKFLDPGLSISTLDALMRKFEGDVESGEWKEQGWPDSAYRVSKMGMTGLNMILARAHPELIINACCPGWVKTDMAPMGTKTPEQGALTPTLLAIGDIDNKTGLFWREEVEVPWTEGCE